MRRPDRGTRRNRVDERDGHVLADCTGKRGAIPGDVELEGGRDVGGIAAGDERPIRVESFGLAEKLAPRRLRSAGRRGVAEGELETALGALSDEVGNATAEGGRCELVRPLAEDANRGHTAAVARAQAEAVRLGARVFLTIPGDVPCVTAEEIHRLLDAAAPGQPAFVPSRSGLGTNGVALAPPDAMPLTFGEPSFERHLAAARARGLEPRVLALQGLGLDVDAPSDLAALLAAPGATASARLVASWRAANRVRPAGVPQAS